MKKRFFPLTFAILLAFVITGCAGAGGTLDQMLSGMDRGTPEPVAVTDSSVSVYFPRAGQDAEGKLIQEIGSAEKTLDVAIYSFTDKKVAKAIADDQERGVAVRMISDKECSGTSSQKACLKIVKEAGIPVKINSHSGIMHLKVSIIDGLSVTTGSYNYTVSAQEKNDENLVVIANETVAGEYEEEFDRMWNDAKNYSLLGS